MHLLRRSRTSGGGSLHELTPLGSSSFVQQVIATNSSLQDYELNARGQMNAFRMPLSSYSAVEASAVSPDASWLLYINTFEVVLASVRSASKKCLHHFQQENATKQHAICFCQDSELAAAARGSDVIVVDVYQQRVLCELRGADADLVACALAPKRAAAAAVTCVGTVHLWRALGVDGAAPPIRIDCSADPPKDLCFLGSRLLAGGGGAGQRCTTAASFAASRGDVGVGDHCLPGAQTRSRAGHGLDGSLTD
jgi:hypothetical protein